MTRFAICCSLILILAALVAPPALACPFCSAVSQTFAEEMASMDVVVLATMTAAADTEPDENGDIERSKFRVTKVLKGEAWIKVDDTAEVHFFGTPNVGETYLLMGTDPPELMWGSPLKVDERPQKYLAQVLQLPEGPGRLSFFMDYLEDEDELLARDAYDEFARTPYEGVIAVKDDMDRAQLMAWIKDRDVPVTRRRLYFTMLGVCGDENDADQLEQLMRSERKEDRAGLNALVGSYLSLKRAAGLPVVEELYLENQEADYADIYAAIMAVRFHGNEGNVIARDELLPGLRSVLERDDLADLVIPDLARWEDWSVIDRLVRLFKEAKPESNWVRVPVINYLRACPLPAAAASIEELKEIDPEAVERANTFFPYAQFEGEKRSGESGDEPGTDGEVGGEFDEPLPDNLAADLASPAEFLAKQREQREKAARTRRFLMIVVPLVVVLAIMRAVLLRRNKQVPQTSETP